jgi:hypothetical protein
MRIDPQTNDDDVAAVLGCGAGGCCRMTVTTEADGALLTRKVGDGQAMKLLRPLRNKAERFIAHGAGNVARVQACVRSVEITRTWHRIFRQTHPSEFAAGRI